MEFKRRFELTCTCPDHLLEVQHQLLLDMRGQAVNYKPLLALQHHGQHLLWGPLPGGGPHGECE